MKRFLQIVSVSILIISCEETTDFVVDNNDKPVIGFVVNDEVSSTLADSVKTSGLVGQFPLDFDLRVTDLNGNITNVGVASNSDSPYLLIQYDSILVDLELRSINPETNEIGLTALLFEEGVQTLEFIVFDGFGESDTASLVLTAFENLKPIVSYQVKTDALSENIRTFDLSESSDQDQKFGGFIKSYHYLIDGESRVVNLNELSHSFPGPGSYAVSLFVTDNNDEVSETESFNVQIN